MFSTAKGAADREEDGRTDGQVSARLAIHRGRPGGRVANKAGQGNVG